MLAFRPILLGLALVASTGFAATGRLDMTFGSNGKALIDFNSPSPSPSLPPLGFDDTYLVAVAPDGKILVAGATSDYPDNVFAPPNKAAVARLNADGTLDATFGSGGRVTMSFGPCSAHCNWIASRPFNVSFQPDGKIVLGGVFFGETRSNVAVVRLNDNGTLDNSFGNGGIASPSMTPTSSDSGTVTLQPDGRILVVGSTHEPQAGPPDFTPWQLAMFRLDANGALDPGFGTGGKVKIDLPGITNGGGSGRLLADGRIQVVSAGGPFGDLSVAIAMFSSNGALESSNVINVTQIGYYSDALAFQPDGKVVLHLGGTQKPKMIRLNADATLDTTFGTDGVVALTRFDALRGILILSDGRIVAETLAPELLRFTPDGKPDLAFGINGSLQIPQINGWIPFAAQPDGRLLLAGSKQSEAYPGFLNTDMVVLRMEPDAPAPIELSLSSLDFGAQSMGMTSPTQSITLTNTTSAPLAITATNWIFLATNDCGSVLAAGASCTLQVAFRPMFEGPNTWTILVNTPAGTAGIPVSGTGERSLTRHFYRTILRRAPDGAGMAFWDGESARLNAAGVNPNETWFAMSAAFYSSAEYAALARDDAGFVTDLYRTFFDRAPDASGMTFWTNLLATGLPRSAALTSFSLSQEFRALTQNVFGAPNVRAEMDMVMDFYRGILARTPDPTGLDHWVGQLRSAQCVGAGLVYARADQISVEFLGGAEYAARARSNADYVSDLYNAFMRRAPDPTGIAYWVGLLDTGSTREELRKQFAGSAEFTGRVNAVAAQGCLQ